MRTQYTTHMAPKESDIGSVFDACVSCYFLFFFFQAEDGIRDHCVTGVQTCALPISWRFVQRDAEGNEFGFHGEYREVVPFERIVETFEFEGMPGHVLVESAVFEEIRGKTKVTQKSVFATVERSEERRVGKECSSGWA